MGDDLLKNILGLKVVADSHETNKIVKRLVQENENTWREHKKLEKDRKKDNKKDLENFDSQASTQNECKKRSVKDLQKFEARLER